MSQAAGPQIRVSQNEEKENVNNRDLWGKMRLLVGVLDAWGVGVDFWLVPRKDNEEAEELANIGLQSGIAFTDKRTPFTQ